MLDHLRRLVAVAVSAGAMTLLFSGLPLGAQEPKVPPSETKTKPAPAKRSFDSARRVPVYFGQLGLTDEQRESIYKIQGNAFSEDRFAGKADRRDPSPESHGVRGALDRLAEDVTRTKARGRRSVGGQQNSQALIDRLGNPVAHAQSRPSDPRPAKDERLVSRFDNEEA